MEKLINEQLDEHLMFLSQHPHFVDADTRTTGAAYVQLITELYKSQIEISNRLGKVSGLCRAWLETDIKRFNQIDAVSLRLKDTVTRVLNENKIDDGTNWAFITIGFNEQTITDSKMIAISDRVSKLKYFKSCYYVLEKHRENGIHHHTHFLVEFHKKEFKSKIIDWVYQVKGMKEVCLKKEFIDVLGPINPKKTYQSYKVYFDYVHGIKKEEKQQYIDADRLWHDSIGISHTFDVRSDV